MSDTHHESTVEFTGLIAGLAATAAATLQKVEALANVGTDTASASSPQDDEPSPAERGKQIRDALSTARQLIDTIAMLETKTKGNVTSGEQQFLERALSELRITFVRVADRVKPLTRT